MSHTLSTGKREDCNKIYKHILDTSTPPDPVKNLTLSKGFCLVKILFAEGGQFGDNIMSPEMDFSNKFYCIFIESSLRYKLF